MFLDKDHILSMHNHQCRLNSFVIAAPSKQDAAYVLSMVRQCCFDPSIQLGRGTVLTVTRSEAAAFSPAGGSALGELAAPAPRMVAFGYWQLI